MPTGKNVRHTKYLQAKMLDPQNTHARKKFLNPGITQKKIPRKFYRPMKYPLQKIVDPQNTLKKKCWTYKIPKRKTFGGRKDPQ